MSLITDTETLSMPANRKGASSVIFAACFAKNWFVTIFPGLPIDELLERMIELSLYTEEHLK